MVTVQTYIPVNLSQLVKSFWCLKVSDFKEKLYKENIIPDGHHEIIFHLSAGNAKRSNSSTGWVSEPDAFFAGQTLNSYSLELKNNSQLYGIRFYPHTLSLLFGFPANDITNTILALHEIPEAGFLKNCISENQEETFKNFETVLLELSRKIDTSTNRFHYIGYSVKEILRNKGNIGIDYLIKKTGVSQRYFDTLFKQSVGINPKQFCSIIRLNHFINYRKTNPSKKLTECCYEAGFFDQSHLIKLFRSATGQSPKEYFRNVNQINDYFLKL